MACAMAKMWSAAACEETRPDKGYDPSPRFHLNPLIGQNLLDLRRHLRDIQINIGIKRLALSRFIPDHQGKSRPGTCH